MYVSRHGVLQQQAAGEAALEEPPHVSLLMHVGAAQARTRLQERQRVSRAAQVRDALLRRMLDENICRQRQV